MSSTILTIRLKAFHPYYINRFILLAKQLIQPLSFVQEKQFFLPRRRERFTVLRSPHVDKKAREQFERRISQRVIRWTFSNLKNNNNFCLYSFFRNLSKLGIGVQMHIVSISQERSKCDFALEIYQRYFWKEKDKNLFSQWK